MLCSSPWSMAKGMQANAAAHAAELLASADIGFRRADAAVPVVSYTTHSVGRNALGMGSACPFETDELVVAAAAPVFTQAECCAVVDEARSLIAEGARSRFTMTDTNRDVAVEDMPKTLAWLNNGAFARLTSLAAACYPGVVDDATDLWVYRALVINYDHSAQLTHQPIHRDHSLISCVVPLSERREYSGGGTFIEPLGRAIALEQGCALLHPSAVRHAGHRITAGERWVLVLFLNTVSMKPAEHGRRFRLRAHESFAREQLAEDDGIDRAYLGAAEAAAEEALALTDDDDDDDDGYGDDDELRNLELAREVTEESDHEIWYDLGTRAHELGVPEEALWNYERAEALNPRDSLLLTNMGVALAELGQPRRAFVAYRRALAIDPYNVNARLSAGELLLKARRLRGLEVLLAEAPVESLAADVGLQRLRAKLAPGDPHCIASNEMRIRD